ncbi:unnamed protein product [Adineta ricciae]|uniref:Uncharacterized protein n=1 Tax=Adineta ricciae TaxID=249248 RepID=A0A814K1Q7_ADIRI|nr:unnamed protein product [Adineta ricciae]CAF1455400.1 unnamed protein product [Adineta ricciae]
MITQTLHAVDYVLLVLLLLTSAIIGIIFGIFKKKKSSAKEFLLGNREMGVFPTALSIAASFLSANTLLGMPSEVYMHGTMISYNVIGLIIATVITALVFMPKFRQMNCTSIYEYLEQRFDRTVRVCVSIVFSFSMLIYMAIVLYAPALALSQTTGLNIWLSVFTSGIVCTFYSSLGGMKAVIWTDVLQALVMLIGLLSAILQGLIVLGGFGPTFSIASKGDRIQFNNMSIDPRVRHTVWSLSIGGTFNGLCAYSFSQTLVQRYMSVRTTQGAKQALFINIICVVFIILSCCFLGIIIYSYYADCDPFTAKYISTIDQIFPYFVMDVLSYIRGLPGIFLACTFSGSLSTISSGLNSLAAVIIEDIYKGLMNGKLTDERQGFVSKIFSIILGIVVMLLTYIASHLGPIFIATISLLGALHGPIMGVFLLGFFFPRANRRGGLIGFISGIVLSLWIFIGSQMTKSQRGSERLPLSIVSCPLLINQTISVSIPIKSDPLFKLYSVSHMWYSTIGVSLVLIVGVIVSYLTHPLESHEIDQNLIISINKKTFRHWFRCDIDHENDTEQTNENELNIRKPFIPLAILKKANDS